MKNNTLFMYHSYNNDYSKCLKNCSQNFIEFNYIKTIKEKGQKNLNIYLKSLLEINNINNIFILLDQCDCSLDIDYLNILKLKYSTKIIFIFQSSQNSFEYIDRYYAQIADVSIISNLLYIQDFYNMLCIPTQIIDNHKYITYNKNLQVDFNLSKILKHNIFSSNLINLSIKVHHEYMYDKLQKCTNYLTSINYQEKMYEKYLTHNILNIMNNSNQISHTSDIIKDKKFIFSFEIYNIYWCLYRYIQTNNIIELKPLLRIKYFFYIGKIVKLFTTIKKDFNAPALKNINIALFKEYTI